MAQIIDGKKMADQIKADLKERVAKMEPKPKLAVVLVGDDPSSAVYVRMKDKSCEELGIGSEVVKIEAADALAAAEKGECRVEAEVRRLNADPAVTGILVQLPLPKGLDEDKIIKVIDPKKDVDCLHPENMGEFMMGRGSLMPLTPRACAYILEKLKIDLAGKKAVVVGRSNIVGRPMVRWLVEQQVWVANCNSQTKDISVYTREADILVSATGKPHLIKGDMVKKGAVVIDVGITRVPVKGPVKPGGKDYRLVGDVEYEAATEKASAITPVPGGVGAMTVAMLMRNVVQLAEGKR